MNISIILCSRNRETAVKQCLAALNQEELKETNSELILVDNNSTDGTPEVYKAFASTSSVPVTLVLETQAGLGRARNAGMVHAKGDILVFLDDDVYFEEGYLRKVKEIFTRGEVDYCGGQIFLYDETDAKYGVIYQENRKDFPPKSFLYAGMIQGANMVVSRKVVDTIGYFDPELGAGTKFRFEDIDYIQRASIAGFTGAHIPELIVYHHHGRKPGPDIINLMKKNAVARGGYYSKLVFMGYLRHFLPVLRKWKHRGTFGSITREIKGFIEYALARFIRWKFPKVLVDKPLP